MSKLICNYDLNTNKWSFDHEDNEDYHSLQLCFRFKGDDPIVKFSNLSFGYTITIDGNEVYTNKYPRSGQMYDSSDQLDLETVSFNIVPGTIYKLFIWCEESGNRTQDTYEIITALPPQPYPSWIWDGSRWISPVPYPQVTEGNVYYWNEEDKTWKVGVTLVDTSGYEVM